MSATQSALEQSHMPKPGCATFLDMQEWAPTLWKAVRGFTMTYPWRPSLQIKELARQLLTTHIVPLILCGECAQHYLEYVSQHPPDVRDRETLVRWWIGVQNSVNRRRGTREWTYEEVMPLWHGGDWREKARVSQLYAGIVDPPANGVLHPTGDLTEQQKRWRQRYLQQLKNDEKEQKRQLLQEQKKQEAERQQQQEQQHHRKQQQPSSPLVHSPAHITFVVPTQKPRLSVTKRLVFGALVGLIVYAVIKLDARRVGRTVTRGTGVAPTPTQA